MNVFKNSCRVAILLLAGAFASLGQVPQPAAPATNTNVPMQQPQMVSSLPRWIGWRSP